MNSDPPRTSSVASAKVNNPVDLYDVTPTWELKNHLKHGRKLELEAPIIVPIPKTICRSSYIDVSQQLFSDLSGRTELMKLMMRVIDTRTN